MKRAIALLALPVCASFAHAHTVATTADVYPAVTSASGGGCEFEEIQLASDGMIEQRSLEIGERVTPNRTMNGTVNEDEYHFYHLCILRHEHEHQINVNLTTSRSSGDANLYLSSMEKYPRLGHASWISQHPGSDFVKLFTYLDGFPRKDDVQNRSIALHIGVFGVDNGAEYNLTVSVLDLPVTSDILSREKYYSKLHHARNPTAPSRRSLRGRQQVMEMASLLLERLATKPAVDDAIRNTKDKVLVLRFGRASDLVCMQQDDILAKCERELSKMARMCIVEAEDIPLYCQYFDITLVPATIFFFNAQHMKVDYGTPDHTKFIGAFRSKQDLIDLVEVIYRGAKHGKQIVQCPIDKSRIPQYELIYRDI